MVVESTVQSRSTLGGLNVSAVVTTRHARTASVLVIVAATIALAGCSGGSSLDGTYYIEDVNGTSDLG